MEVDSQRILEILESAAEGEETIYGEEGDEVEEIVEIIEEIEEIEEEEQTSVTNGIDNNHEENHKTNKVKTKQRSHYNALEDWEDDEENLAQRKPQMQEEFISPEFTNENANEEVLITGNLLESVESDQVQVNKEHETVQNVENNSVYTVIGSNAVIDNTNLNSQSADLEFIPMKAFTEDAGGEGTIYYQSADGENIYVQAVGDQQYEYTQSEQSEPVPQENQQEWVDENQQQQQEPQQPEDNHDNQEQQPAPQEQILLHEDEDGQLYFKNEHGKLQPVYMTEDGNYAIAEASNDDESSQGSGIPQTQQEHQQTLQIQQQQLQQIIDDAEDGDTYVLPDAGIKPASKKRRLADSSYQEPDEDSTVTISLIISEDENGQKRTQVIIPSPATDLKCDICNKTFKTNFQLLKHNRLKHAREEDITTRNFPCDLCPKRFPDQNSLARHRKVHTGDRPFQCLECHKTFPTANTLRKHLTLHNPEDQPLPCIYCGRRFSDKPSLIKHEQSHLAGEMRTHSCDICHKCFTNAADLNLHKKNHDPDRKFDCEVCGREFNRLNNLQRHMMVHQQQPANDDVLSCHVCGITYKFSSSLTRHMVTTHMNPEKLRQQAEEQRRKRESNYRRYLENRKTYETVRLGDPFPMGNHYPMNDGMGSEDDEDME